MEWLILVIPVALFLAFRLISSMSFIAPEAARQHLAQGALIIDVRSPEEFAGGSIPGAINIPLGELHQQASGRVEDKSRVLLLHCLSGARSGIARRQLKSMGYTNVFNLGSFARARNVVKPAGQG